jgi:hypothetical protein
VDTSLDKRRLPALLPAEPGAKSTELMEKRSLLGDTSSVSDKEWVRLRVISDTTDAPDDDRIVCGCGGASSVFTTHTHEHANKIDNKRARTGIVKYNPIEFRQLKRILTRSFQAIHA